MSTALSISRPKNLPEGFSLNDLYPYLAEKHDGQYWGSAPYLVHLLFVKDKVLSLMGKDTPVWLLAVALLHDVIEDTKTTHDELASRYGAQVADGVFALSRVKDESKAITFTRIAQAGEDIIFVKLCDRIVNVQYSWQNRSRQLFKYREEYRLFKSILCTGSSSPHIVLAWRILDELLHAS